MYYRILFILGVISVFSSCATLLNPDKQSIDFIPDKNIKILSVKRDSTNIRLNENSISLSRKSTPITVKYLNQKDTIQRELNSYISNSYWWNIYFNYGLGMLVDDESDKKYVYLKRVYITNDNFLVKEKKGNHKITFGSEYSGFGDRNFSAFTIVPYNFNIGLEYYHVHNQFIWVENHIGLYYLWVDKYYNGYFSAEGIDILNFNNNHVFNHFEVGYGLSFLNSNNFHKMGWNISGTNMLGKTFGLNLNINFYSFDLKDMSSYLTPNYRLKLLFKIPIRNKSN